MCGDCISEHLDIGSVLAPATDLDFRAGEAEAISILIVKDRSLCAAGVAHLVAAMGVEGAAGVAADLGRASEIAGSPAMQLVLVDLATIGFDFEGLRRLALATHAPIIVIDERLNTTFSGLARQAGARGYIAQSFDLAQASAVIRSVMVGGEHFPRSTQRGGTAVAMPGAGGLSARRMEVLKCVALGMSNTEIGRVLGIAAGTVKVHIHEILRITGARNRTEVAVNAERLLGREGR